MYKKTGIFTKLMLASTVLLFSNAALATRTQICFNPQNTDLSGKLLNPSGTVTVVFSNGKWATWKVNSPPIKARACIAASGVDIPQNSSTATWSGKISFSGGYKPCTVVTNVSPTTKFGTQDTQNWWLTFHVMQTSTGYIVDKCWFANTPDV